MLIYLHGLASSPQSNKAVHFRNALQERGIEPIAPDLNQPEFRTLTLSRIVGVLEQLTDGAKPRSVKLIGSSLGGYAAALFAAQSEKVAAQVLMAPAFDFHRTWSSHLGPQELQRWQKDGETPVFHHARQRNEMLGYGLMADAAVQTPYPSVSVPTWIVHGKNDDTVDPRVSQTFAKDQSLVELQLIDSDHQLSDAVPSIVEQALAFLNPWL